MFVLCPKKTSQPNVEQIGLQAMLTVGKHADGENIPMLGQIAKGHIGRTLPDHQMDCDQALEDDSPCGVAQTVLQRPKDLSDAGLAGMCGDEDVFDVLRLGGSGLPGPRLALPTPRRPPCDRRATDLDLGSALDGLLKGTGHGGVAGPRGTGPTEARITMIRPGDRCLTRYSRPAVVGGWR